MTNPALAFIRQTYVDGNCHFLARCLAVKTSWPVSTLLSSDGKHAFHVFVVTPEGMCLDIDGLHTPKRLAQQWGGSVINGRHHAIVEGDLDDEFEDWGSVEENEEDDPEDVDYSEIWSDADSAADEVLAQYLPGQFSEDE